MFRSLLAMYSLPRCSAALVAMLQSNGRSSRRYLKQFWTTQDFSVLSKVYDSKDTALRLVLLIGMAMQISAGLLLIILWQTNNLVAGELFGLALVVSYPVVWAHIVGLYAAGDTAGYYLPHPKKLGKAIICIKLESQVRKLQKTNDFKIIAVAGSVGKTSSKLAIADVLQQSFRVRHQIGNYNDRVTVPLVFFGNEEPGIFNIVAWFKIFRANAQALKKDYPYDVVVVELGTDGMGFMKEFSYLKVDLAVLTAITPEHMEYFGSLDNVADEELTIFDYSQEILINVDDTPVKYLTGKTYKTYSLEDKKADYVATVIADGLQGQKLDIQFPNGYAVTASNHNIGKPGAKTTLAAAAVAHELGMKPAAIATAVKQLAPFAGRMQVLAGVDGTILVDDTYNATPIAVEAALDVLYDAKASQRIAILGSMNELGDYSKKAHQEVGTYCDSQKLAWVVTIGQDANKYLAPAAKKRGCQVKTFTSPYEAGAFVRDQITKDALVLAKGSQNGVFAEEALKVLLADPADETKLVRQSAYWMKIKRQQFPR